VLGLIFLKYISNSFQARYDELAAKQKKSCPSGKRAQSHFLVDSVSRRCKEERLVLTHHGLYR